MSRSKKSLAAAIALILGFAGIGPVGSAHAQNQAQDTQTIINQLIQQVNSLQQQQQSPAPAAATTTTDPAPATPSAPVAPVAPSAPVAPAAPIAAAPLETTTTQGVTLTFENLPTFTTAMGYETKKVNDTLYSINASRDNWTLIVNVWADKVQNKVWLFAYMREIPDLSKAPAECLLRLLEANNKIGPTHFYLSKNYLYMGRAFENGTVTPIRFRAEVDQFFADMQKTESLWLVENWSATNSNNQLSSTTTAPVPAPTP